MSLQSLSSNDELENSPFSINNKMRSRLLQRIHLAYLRKVQQANSNSGGDEAASSVTSVHGGCNSGQSQQESSDAILTATSIRMSLAILQCLGPASKKVVHSFLIIIQ
jgi:hypothetical protein